MIVKIKRSSIPPWNATIWRYMSLEKFLDMILNDRLFFANSSRLTDKNEGAFSNITISRLEKKYKDAGMNNNEAESEILALQQKIDLKKSFSYINCWTIDQNESYALWKIYLSGTRSGVAIKTNLKRLAECFNDSTEDDMFISKVEYEDFIKEPVDILGALTTKRKCYKYENELRLITFKDPVISKTTGKIMTRNGIRIKINPETLIHEIYLSPFAGSSFNKIFKQTLAKLAPQYIKKLKDSEITDE